MLQKAKERIKRHVITRKHNTLVRMLGVGDKVQLVNFKKDKSSSELKDEPNSTRRSIACRIRCVSEACCFGSSLHGAALERSRVVHMSCKIDAVYCILSTWFSSSLPFKCPSGRAQGRLVPCVLWCPRLRPPHHAAAEMASSYSIARTNPPVP